MINENQNKNDEQFKIRLHGMEIPISMKAPPEKVEARIKKVKQATENGVEGFILTYEVKVTPRADQSVRTAKAAASSDEDPSFTIIVEIFMVKDASIS